MPRFPLQNPQVSHSSWDSLPPANEVCEEYVLHLSVSHSVHRGWYPSMHCRWYPSMPCMFPGPHPGGKLRGLAWVWVSRPTPRQVSRPTPRRVSRPTPGGSSPGPHPGGSPGPHLGECIPACTEADFLMATAVGSTHPTGINSCFKRSVQLELDI